MAEKRKGRTGLEWLLEKGHPEKAEENGSGGAAPPAAPDATGPSEEDLALAMLDLPQPAPTSTVLSKAPAESSLALEADAQPAQSDTPHKRGLDAVANALLVAEPPPPKPVVEEPHTDEVKTKKAAARVSDGPVVALEPAKTPDPPTPAPDEAKTKKARARVPDEPAAALESATTPEPLPDEVKPEPAAEIADDLEADEPSLPPAVQSEPDAVTAHRRRVTSGRSTRAFPRVNVSFEVRFKKTSDAITGAGRNVSVGGFFVETKKLLPDGEVFQAQLFFTKEEKKLSVIAEVMWTSGGDPEASDRFPAGMGCKFLDVDERDAPFIQGIIDAALAAGSGTP